MINIEEIKMSLWKKNVICEGEKINDNFGGDNVDSVEEAEIRSSTYSVNDNDYLVSGFDTSTCSGEDVYDIFENKDKIITEYLNVWVDTNKSFWERRVIQRTCIDFPQDYGLIQKRIHSFD